MGRIRSIPGAVFAGDRRVWRVAALVGLPLVIAVVVYCAWPRPYFTGTNSVEALSYIAPAKAGEKLCVPELHVPAGTGRVQLQIAFTEPRRPALTMKLRLRGRAVTSSLPSRSATAAGVSDAIFAIHRTSSTPESEPASLCVTARGAVNWAGTPLLPVPPHTPTLGGKALGGKIAVRYLPSAGRTSSYIDRAAAILRRAALFRPGGVDSALYFVLLLALLPALALLAVRCLALAVSRSIGKRALAASLFAIAALNFACWALITPPFQAPDEVDHFAYTQSLVERGKAPSRNPAAPLPRWSSAETLALEGTDFTTDHQAGDSRMPWLRSEQRAYEGDFATLHPAQGDDGGDETAATHGPIYYLALVPGYLLGGSSTFAQLTWMRLCSALIGALAVLFTFLLAFELAPERPWLGVLAGLLVAYQPMYGFISGAVNNDVAVNAGAAALAWLTVRMLRRGITLRAGIALGVLLGVLPFVKATALSLYPVVALGVLLALWRHRPPRAAASARWRGLVRRMRTWRSAYGLAGGAAAAVALYELVDWLSRTLHPAEATAGTGEAGIGAANAASLALRHPFGFLGYLWELFLPRLPFMTPHFETTLPAGYQIFVERGWGAFGWYDVFFPRWMYVLIAVLTLLTVVLALIALWREWSFLRTHLPEAIVIVLIPIAVVVGFEATYYTTGARPVVAEFGRYAFPAIAALAVLVVGALHAFGRRHMLLVGVALGVAMIALSYVSQLKTLTGFYA